MGLPMGLPSLTLPFILLGFEKFAFKTCRAGLFKHNEFFLFFFSVLRTNVLVKTVITS